MKEGACEKRRVEREGGACVGEVRVGGDSHGVRYKNLVWRGFNNFF